MDAEAPREMPEGIARARGARGESLAARGTGANRADNIFDDADEEDDDDARPPQEAEEAARAAIVCLAVRKKREEERASIYFHAGAGALSFSARKRELFCFS